MKYKVLVIQRRLTHYRVAFFEALRRECYLNDIELILAHGEGTSKEIKKNDAGFLDWAIKLPTSYFLDGKICWQRYGKLLKDVELLIVTSENKLICNFFHQLFNYHIKFIYWGHGANLQGNPNSLKEKFKRLMMKYADWWLGYTSMSTPLILKSGFPLHRITVLNNTIDTAELSNLCSNVDEEKKTDLKNEYDLIDKHVGIYLGSLYEEKRIDFLLDAAEQISLQDKQFRLLIIGGGQQQELVEKFCARNKWAIYLGVRKGQEKANFLAISDIMLNPGLVGLGILDSFVAGVPMITTDCGLHSPEIVYLQHQINGIMSENSQEAFIDEIVGLFKSPVYLDSLKAGCRKSAEEFTIENMAKNFTSGLIQCIKSPRLRGGL